MTRSPAMFFAIPANLSFYSNHRWAGMMLVMVDFDLFVKTLGPHAKQYTEEQLRQLHVEVQKLAEVLLAVHEAKVAARRKAVSPQPNLDGTGTDRTMTRKLTERAAAKSSSAVQVS